MVTIQLNLLTQKLQLLKKTLLNWKSRPHGTLTSTQNLFKKLHINLKPFCDLLHENTTWKWTDEHETLFQTFETSLTSERELTIPYSRRFAFCLGDVLFQMIKKLK